MHKSLSQTFQRRHPFAVALGCLLFFMWHGHAVAFPARLLHGDAITERLTAATRQGRLAIFDDVWRTVRERYYDPALHGLDWSAMRAEFRPLAATAKDQTELYALLRRMLARLRDSHTRIYAPDERFDWREPRFVGIGVRVREIEGQLIVSEIERGSEAALAGLRAGDVIVRVDGEPAATIMARRLQEQTGAMEAQVVNVNPVTTVRARVVAAARIFDGPRDSLAEVIFKSGDDHARERSVRLRRGWHARSVSLRVRRTGARGRIGVVQFNIFTESIVGELARSLKNELPNARGLVIDLRDNGGGESEAMTDIASLFLPAATKLGRFTDRAGRVKLELQTRSALLSAAAVLTNFQAPLMVLTSTRTASAAEVFIAALKKSKRAQVVGENTCGCVLGLRRRHTLPDGGLLDISEMDFHTPNGTRLENTGVTPDEYITPTRRDLRANHDRALERALEMLKNEIKKQR